jgi:acyl carrier protein
MTTPSSRDVKILQLLTAAVPGRFRKTAISRDSQLQRDLGLDSIAILSLVFRFEEEFGVDLLKLNLNIDVARLRTAGDVMDIASSILESARGRFPVSAKPAP